MSSDESIWRMRVMSAATPEYVGELVRCKDCEWYDCVVELCYRDPNHSGYYRHACDDGFCAWAKKRED